MNQKQSEWKNLCESHGVKSKYIALVEGKTKEVYESRVHSTPTEEEAKQRLISTRGK